jgi:hypothetical protein
VNDDALTNALAAAAEASKDSKQLELMQAVVIGQAIAQAMQPQQPAPAPARQEFDAKKWVTIGGLCLAGGLVASLFAVAVAIGAVSVAILALVLRGLWRDYLNHR